MQLFWLRAYSTLSFFFSFFFQVEVQEERARVAKLQRALYRHFASKAIPKGLHCLELRLTAEHAANPLASKPLPAPALVPHLYNNSLLHLVLITDNIFAASVVVASAVQNSASAENLVFHILTDGMSFPAMHAWFSLYPPVTAVVEVLSIDELESMTNGTMPVQEVLQGSEALKKHYFGDNTDLSPNSFDSPAILAAKLAARNPKYISIMNHLRMYLPMVSSSTLPQSGNHHSLLYTSEECRLQPGLTRVDQDRHELEARCQIGSLHVLSV